MGGKIKKALLDALFPVFCLSCRREGEWLCVSCRRKIEPEIFQTCPFCKKIITSKGEICPDCRKKFSARKETVPLDSLLVSASFQNELVASLVHLLKYNFVEDLAPVLGGLILKTFRENDAGLPDLIIPVPLHPRRLRWRGFNQAELLAGFLSRNLAPGMEIPVASDVVFRKRYSPPQAKIENRERRRKNMENIFGIKNPAVVKNKNVLLIDDVATTGATLFECGKILKLHGARKVCGAVVGR